MPNNHYYEIHLLAQKLELHVCHRLISIWPDRPASFWRCLYLLMCSVFCKTVFPRFTKLGISSQSDGIRIPHCSEPLENVSKSLLHIKLGDLLSAGKQQKSSLVCLLCHTSSGSYCSVSLREHSSFLTCHMSFIWRANVCIITSFLPHLHSLHQQRHRRTTSNPNRTANTRFN